MNTYPCGRGRSGDQPKGPSADFIPMIYIDLVGLDEEVAKKRHLDEIESGLGEREESLTANRGFFL